jgi:hypothetical protein
LKKAAEEETAHIDEMLEYKSEVNRSKFKLGRNTRHQQAAKSAKQNRNELKAKRDARKKDERGVKSNGKRMGRQQWQNGSAVAVAEGLIEKI